MRMQWLAQTVRLGFLSVALASTLVGGTAALHAGESVATHKQVRTIVPKHQGVQVHLNTFCVGPDQNLYLCCNADGGVDGNGSRGVVLVYTGEGELVREIPLSFAPQAINFSSQGAMFLAGAGKVARLSSEGAVEIEKDAPNIGNKEEMLEQLAKAAEEQRKTITASYTDQLEKIKSQIEAIENESEKADPDDKKGAARRERRMRMLTQQRDQWQTIVDQIGQSLAAPTGDDALRQVMRSTGLAVSNQDVFFSLPNTVGYGYSIYRTNHDLEESTVVKRNVGGCCGQLDIQSDGENLLIAENTSFTVGIYDRDGKKLTSWGKRGRTEPDGFGSCCNPMNVRCCPNGEILTAESSIGDIKRFSKSGEFLGFVGRATVAGGCKHVAIGWDNKRDWHYMMHQDKSTVAVLVPKDQAPAETDEERLSRIAMEEFGSKLVGTWEVIPAEKGNREATADGVYGQYDFISQGYGHLEFAADGSLIHRVSSSPKAQPSSDTVIGGILGSVIDAIGGDSVATIADVPQRPSTWKAVKGQQGELELVTYEEDVEYYGAMVKWVSDEEIEMKWFILSPEQSLGHPARYRLVSRSACGQECESGKKPESSGDTTEEKTTTGSIQQTSRGEGQ